MATTPLPTTRWHRRALLLLAAAALACTLGGCAGPADRARPPARAETAEIPHAGAAADMPICAGLPLVPVMLNGHGPFWMVLDTGAETVFLSTHAARECGMTLTAGTAPFYTTDGRPDGVREIQIGRVGAIEIGSARFGGFDAIVRDIEGISAATGRRVDGLLGALLLRRGVWTMDYRAQHLAIAPDAHGLDAADWIDTVPLGPNRSAIGVHAFCAGQRLDLLLDTGSVDEVSLSTVDAGRLAVAAGPAGLPVLRRVGQTERSSYFGTTPRARYRLLAALHVGAADVHPSEVVEAVSCSSIGSGALSRVMLDLAHDRVVIEFASGSDRR